MVARILRAAPGLALALVSGCLTRPNPCIEGGPPWLVAQCEIGEGTGSESDGGSESGGSSTDTDTETDSDSGGEVCDTRLDCCDADELDECTQKCVPVSDGRRLCYDSGFGRFNEPCDNLEADLRDTCDRLHVCVTHVSADGGSPNEGYCKPLCDENGECPGLSSAYTCTINGLCRRPCDPGVGSCGSNESCRWIVSEEEVASQFDCQPIAVELDAACVPQLKPDLPGDCPAGSMCIEEVIEGLPVSRCATFCDILEGCAGDVVCEPFVNKIPEEQRPVDPLDLNIGFCAE